MNPNYIILGAAVVGLIVNTLAILGVAWRGGRLLGQMEKTLEGLSGEVTIHRTSRDEHARLLERVSTQLEGMTRELEKLQDRVEALAKSR